MSVELPPEVLHATLIELLQKSEATTNFTPEELEKLANQAEFRLYKQGEIIVQQHDPANEFYFVLSGQVRVLDTDQSPPRLVNYHWRGQFFGERALLTSGRRALTVDVVADAQVAVFNRRVWEESLIGPHPRMRQYFEGLRRRYARNLQFDFPGRQWDEVAVINTNRHILSLLISFIGPTMMLIIGLIILATLIISSTLPLWGIFLGFLPYVLIVIGWYIYSYIEWDNDDFIISNKRVIHIERTILFGEHRYESPLSEIQDVTVETRGFISRSFDFYNVIIQTAGAGSIVFDGVSDSFKIKEAIFEERRRAIERIRAADLGSIRSSLAARMEWDVLDRSVAPIDTRPVHIEMERTRHLPGLLDYLIPRVREMDEDKITWRKHPYILLKAIFMPAITLLIVSYLLLASLILAFPFHNLFFINFTLSAVLVGAWVGAFFWYLWRYDDWHKDVYVVTESQIIDIQSSAFRLMGEKARQGTFDVVQNINFESPNFFARLLNLGDVTIETAGTAETFTFEEVYDPRTVQQEIFKRWVNFKEGRRRAEREAEEERFTQWLSEYHTMRELSKKRHPERYFD
ncbi:MAG: cyclic nucleotide-binding domain-containing protein [Anaerolineae bacterium]